MMLHSNSENLSSLESCISQKLRNNDLFKESDLCKIMKNRGSDKCSDWHNYTPVYNLMFGDIKSACKEVFELGIFYGSSTRGWSDYFYNARITAADIDKNCLINEERIESYLCDQDSSESIASLWERIGDRTFDIMIDDGKHEYSSNLNFLLNSIHRLNRGGFYIVEDLTNENFQRMTHDIERLKIRLQLSELFLLDIPNPMNKVDNKLMIAIK